MSGERFKRIELLLGQAALTRLSHSFIAVVGLGAVGSYAVEALARAGIGRLRLVDFDEIRESNINRQLYALGSTIGELKSAAAANRVRDINPSCKVEALNVFFAEESAEGVLADAPDIVIDAIDSLNPKVELLASARARSLELISVMGAARRQDPFAVRFGPLAEVTGCPLARAVRRRLRRRGVTLDFPCVYSEEINRKTEKQCVAREEEFYRRGRERTPIGSLPTITGMFGLIAAHQAILQIAGTCAETTKLLTEV